MKTLIDDRSQASVKEECTIKHANAVLNAMIEINPKDQIKGMLTA